MSLKALHILFIALSIVLAIGFGWWCLWYARSDGQAAYRTAGVISFLAGGALVVYGVWFLRKLRTWDRDSLRKKTRPLVVITAATLAPGLAQACEVCYGAADSPWIDASQAAVGLLLGVTVAVQIAFAAFFLRMRKRAKAMQERRSEMGLVEGKGAA